LQRSVRDTRRSRATRPKRSANSSPGDEEVGASLVTPAVYASSPETPAKPPSSGRWLTLLVRSWAFLISRRWIGFALIVALLAYLAWWLGEWQFRRLDDRQQRNAVFERNVDADPAPVTDVLAADEEVPARSEWRRISATGTYDPENTVVVRYQTRKSSSGVDVVVPLELADGQAIVVDRGWLLSDNTGTAVTEIPAPPTGEVEITGWVRRNARGASAAVTEPAGAEPASTRAISSETIAERIDRPLLKGFVVLEKESPAPATPLLPAELPDVGNGPHFFYGLQWWFFGALAVGGFGYLAYDERRGGRPQRTATGVAPGAKSSR
jgi:cytochrome oxidase assembly protein ShyY1